jgi:hypothetical protein
MISAAEFGLSVMAFIWTVLDILLVCNFWEVEFTAVIMPIFFFGLTKPNIQRTEEGNVASRAKIANRPIIPQRNVVRDDVMVAPLDFINEII